MAEDHLRSSVVPEARSSEDDTDRLQRHAEGVLLARRMQALNGPEMRLRDWDASFVGDVCWRQPEDLTARQREMVALLCWRYRGQIPAELAPPAEPKLSPKRDAPAATRRWADRPIEPRRRQRG